LMQEKMLKIWWRFKRTLQLRIHQNSKKSQFHHCSNKIVEVEERDHVRKFQPPISGKKLWNYIIYNPREIGVLKEAIKEAILGEILMIIMLMILC
jgi:hypothetical protein